MKFNEACKIEGGRIMKQEVEWNKVVSRHISYFDEETQEEYRETYGEDVEFIWEGYIPEEGTEVIVFEDGCMRLSEVCCNYPFDCWFDAVNYEVNEPIYWMFLPKTPEQLLRQKTEE